MSDSSLEKLLRSARNVPVTASDREKQRRSFAYGNTRIENAQITRQTVDKAAEKLHQAEQGGG